MGRIMTEKTRKKFLVLYAAFMVMLLMAVGLFLRPIEVAAAKLLDLDQIEQEFEKAIKKGENTVTFSASGAYTTAQIQEALEQAAIRQNRLLAGSVQLSKQKDNVSGEAKYQILLSQDALVKVKKLKSRSAAVKAAADALKNRKYTKNFYSDTSYYDVFKQVLQQHPEYNYNTVVWRSSNGSYGYHLGDGLSKKEQKKKIQAADKAAKKAVGKCIKAKMSDKQKAKAIHNYLLKNCSYDERVPLAGNQYNDAFTAYGALVNGSAVCQGYTAAFNLMAAKCGLQSMAVCGTAGGVSHAWNYVKIGSKYRYIDCTWDDTIQNDGKLHDTYFNVKADKMREQHRWNESEFPSKDIKNSKYFK